MVTLIYNSLGCYHSDLCKRKIEKINNLLYFFKKTWTSPSLSTSRSPSTGTTKCASCRTKPCPRRSRARTSFRCISTTPTPIHRWVSIQSPSIHSTESVMKYAVFRKEKMFEVKLNIFRLIRLNEFSIVLLTMAL